MLRPVPVPVMYIRVMRMVVCNRPVAMSMIMRLAYWILWRMLVLVMVVVDMAMCMLKCAVSMSVLVSFREV
jgi:hypothetical protein